MPSPSDVRDVSRAYTATVVPSATGGRYLTNDPAKQIRVLTEIKAALAKSERFCAAIAFITKSGVVSLYQALVDFSERGGQARILASDYLYFTQPEALEMLAGIANVEVRLLSDVHYHGKIYHFDHGLSEQVIIGSSNLTQYALSQNDELNFTYHGQSSEPEIERARDQIERLWANTPPLSNELLEAYSKKYAANRAQAAARPINLQNYYPNSIQKDALHSLNESRSRGKKRGLVVSATGTGKTVLSAFDIRQTKTKRALFVVHRSTIAKKALSTFQSILGANGSYGLVGGQSNDWDADYLFSTVQTISRPENLARLAPERFEYIVIDETHRAASASYQRIIDHFRPRFLLGMTATPDRSDSQDIYEIFDNNVVSDIRLQDALAADLLCPFHYFGVSELVIEGRCVDDNADLSDLRRPDRFEHLLATSKRYGADTRPLKCLVFLSRVEEALAFAGFLGQRGHAAQALTGGSSEIEKENAIHQIEAGQLEYIVTVDLFNEGVDIPSINQLLMARPTTSAIVFIQQFGRGLRKHDQKEYLTVIDIVGNYENNYNIPIALYGDRTRNKDRLRRLMRAEETMVPGVSTISFDRITKERIFKSIQAAKQVGIRELKFEYKSVQAKTGKTPTLMTCREHGELDPLAFCTQAKCKSLHEFAMIYDPDYAISNDAGAFKLLGLLIGEALDGVHGFEPLILKQLLQNGRADFNQLSQSSIERFQIEPTTAQFNAALNVVSLNYGRPKGYQQYEVTLGQTAGASLREISRDQRSLLIDAIDFALAAFADRLAVGSYCNGFVVGTKYTYKQTFRILGWPKNPNPQNVGGYFLHRDTNDLAIFVNYNKDDSIAETTQYEDRFISNDRFHWTTKNSRTPASPEVLALTEQSKSNLRVPLFIRKEAASEGSARYYLGEMTMIHGTPKRVSVGGKSAVSMDFQLDQAVPQALFQHIVDP